MELLVVTAGIIRKDNKILLAQRKPNSHLGYRWEFPGGKMEKGESPEACLMREIREEINIEIEVIDIFSVIFHKYNYSPILLLAYLCNYQQGEAIAKDCADFRWITIEELSNFSLIEVDISIAEKIIKLGERLFLMNSL